LLIQIFVPTTDPDGKGSIGTGYPVAPGRILTARHVLFPENRVGDNLGEVRWYHQNGEHRKWRRISAIVWEDEEADVAVIECDFPVAINRFGSLTRSQPKTDARWESEGFARAGRKDDGGNPPVPLKGAAYSMGGHGVFHLGVDDPAYEPSLWKGASGSPVFVDEHIIGVIVSSPQNFNAGRFAAMPTWKLLQNRDFRDVVHYSSDSFVKPMKLNFSGKTKYAFTTRLGESWGDLANLLEIPAHEQRRFRSGYEANSIWEWAQVHKRLAELPALLPDIGRNDLVELFVEHERED
jgi:hypothetical protein